MFPIKTDDWNRYLDGIFELISNDEAPLYEPKMNAYLEETVAKYLHPSDDYVSLTEIARKYDAANPSYLIQSWLRSRNTVEFLATWERKHMLFSPSGRTIKSWKGAGKISKDTP